MRNPRPVRRTSPIRSAGFWLTRLVLAGATLAGCSSAESSGASGPYGPRPTGMPTGSTPPPTTGTSPTPPGQGGGGAQPGTLTSGAWDDNLNFDFYRRYLDSMAAVEGQNRAWPFVARADRLEVLVTNELGAPLGDAPVTITGPSGQLVQARSSSDGRVFALPSWFGIPAGTPLVVSATHDGLAGSVSAVAGDVRAVVPVAGAVAALPATLDVALVIDTTGSMGDEISYLKVELENIVNDVRARYPAVVQRFALIVYRDQGDPYVVRTFDFTTNPATIQSELAAQSAGGGGDYPESPDLALAALGQLSWSPAGAARLVFWVADAPHHDDRAPAMLTDFKQSFSRGSHIYPIASSGVDELTEFTMRTAAQLTGGRYLFLTDDSGIGDTHKIPTIPCYVVTTLERAMLRMIFMELSGVHVEPAPTDVIRAAGSPTDGRCLLDDGQQTDLL
jgi:hypothetical protein